MNKDILLEKAFEAMKNSYAPYSKYNVGACVLTKDGSYIKGCNIENASFGATNCAERTAIFATYANGYKKEDVVALAIVSNGDRIAAPCGICRQVLSELIDLDTPIYLSNGKDEVTTCIRELLPMNFTTEDVIR